MEYRVRHKDGVTVTWRTLIARKRRSRCQVEFQVVICVTSRPCGGRDLHRPSNPVTRAPEAACSRPLCRQGGSVRTKMSF